MSFAVGSLPDDSAFAWDNAAKEVYFRQALTALTNHHRTGCPAYRRILGVLGFSTADSIDAVPFLPVRLFKTHKLLSVNESDVVKTVASSGTGGQTPSRVYLDRTTALNQAKALLRIVSHFTGKKRLPTLIIDSEATLRRRDERSARAAGIVGFAALAHGVVYALDEGMNLNFDAVSTFLDRCGAEPFLVFGLTSILWEHFYRPLARLRRTFDMSRGVLFHGGGWKKLQDQAVSSETFGERLREVCRIGQIHDYYGMAEQTGSIFVECECGRLHASIFSDVLIRDPADFSILPPGRRGLIQLMSLLPESYPGHSILTEDVGEILGVDDCPCGRLGRTFRVHGRIQNAEIRGCSDTYRREPFVRGGTVSPTSGAPATENEPGRVIECLVGDADRFTPLRLPPYSEIACAFFDALSKELRQHAAAKALPDVAAFAFWCRRSNIRRMKNTFDSRQRRIGRGTAFHIAPSNVPVNFAYSFAFGLLAGNGNIVRVPSKRFAQVDAIAESVRTVLAQERFAPLRSATVLIRYERDDVVTAELSSRCDARILWGGDETIRRARAMTIRPRAVEIAFADRYSFAWLNAEKIAALDTAALRRLAEGFVNDALSMGQRACSAPHLIVWTADSAPDGRRRFWGAVAEAARKFPLEPLRAIDKITTLCANAIDFDTPGPLERYGGNRIYTVRLGALPKKLDVLRGDAGLFYEYTLGDSEEWADRVTDKFQTVVTFGVDRKKIADWVVEHQLGGIDRIVPVGLALDIGPVWDGIDVIRTLSRLIDCPGD